MVIAGINGFGRFGLHLLKYWLDRSDEAGFNIRWINDERLPFKKAYDIIRNDKYVVFDNYDVQAASDTLVILGANGTRHIITYTNKPVGETPWLGKADIVFECSGKHTAASTCGPFLSGDTKLVLISATSWDADATIIYGFNHQEFSRNHRIISYGSCTVNAYVPLANFLHKKFRIINSDVYVIHNVPEYRLKDSFTLNRKFCTLEAKAIELLPFLDPQNFLVNYTVVPYTGPSIIDLRFHLKSEINVKKIIKELERAIESEELKGLYSFDEYDRGPEAYNCTTYSAVFIKKAMRTLEHNLYFYGYLDTENSANRFFDLANYITTHRYFLSRMKSYNNRKIVSIKGTMLHKKSKKGEITQGQCRP